MKLELKTDNENSFNAFSHFFKTISILVLIIIFCDVALKLGIISRHYQILYNCRIIYVDKSKSSYKITLTGGYARIFKKLIKKKTNIDQDITIKGVAKVFKEFLI